VKGLLRTPLPCPFRRAKFEDPFGHNWAVATHIEDVPPEELAKRAAAAFAPKK
jgi:hypothetical protein